MSLFLIKAFQLIVALAILVIIHEFGHYITARMFGMKVNRFYLFFNPWFSLLKYYPDQGKVSLIGWTVKKTKTDPETGKEVEDGEEPRALVTFKVGKPHAAFKPNGRPTWAATMYGIGWLPLGGYCDIAGMVDETKTAADLSSTSEPWEFRSKPAWQRLIVMVAGVVFNFLLATIIYAGMVMYWGERTVPYPEAYEGMDYAPLLHKAGFEDGDVLLAINGEVPQVKDTNVPWRMMQPGTRVTLLRNHCDTINIVMPEFMLDSLPGLKTAPMTFRVPVYVDKTQPGMPAQEAGLLAGDRIVKVDTDTTPSMREFYAALDARKGLLVDVGVIRDGQYLQKPLQLTENGKMGIQLRAPDQIFPVEDIEYGFFESIPRGWQMGTTQLVTYVQSLKLVFTKEGAQQIGGFGTIGSLFPDSWNWYSFWQITAFLSVILAFMNIIPIPALDGGHLLFLLWEIGTGKKPSDKFMETAGTIGFAFLALLLIYANLNDILRWFNF